MTVDQLVKAARTIMPKVLFPYHFSQTPISQVVMKLAGSGIDVRIRDYQWLKRFDKQNLRLVVIVSDEQADADEGQHELENYNTTVYHNNSF